MALTFGDIVAALAYAGVGTAVGSVGAAIVSSRTGRGEARAHAVDMISDAAANLADRQAVTINRLSLENEKLRRAVITLADVIDDVLPKLNLTDAELAALRRALNGAKVAV